MDESALHAFVSAAVERYQPLMATLADDIWDHPETRFVEHYSSDRLATELEQAGFKVERGLASMETAFVASYGEGHPVIALLGEFDALTGLSQQGGCCTHQPINAGGNGHGCGHHLLGSAMLGAAMAIQSWLQQQGGKGTVRFYGCPGEEGGSGKTFMARDGVFDGIDAALTWHPETVSGIFSTPTLANIQAAFRFKGIAAHAAVAPHLGRSALDAVTLMNTGANFLREHIISEARLHYAVTDSGGHSPNVVQANAEVLYLVRAPRIDQAQAIYERLVNIGKGAALMTDTRLEVRFDKACSNYEPNRALERIMYCAVQAFGVPEYNDEELYFAQQMSMTLSDDDMANTMNHIARIGGKAGQVWAGTLHGLSLAPLIAPYEASEQILPASTDVGDVSWLAPTAQCFTPCYVLGTALHSWQAVSQGRTSIAHKGMVLAANIVATTALTLLADPEALSECKKEWSAKRQAHTYHCPIPPEIMPSPIAV